MTTKQAIPNGTVLGGLLDATPPLLAAKPPKRAYQLVIRVDGDTWEDVVRMMREINTSVRDVGPDAFPCLSGGYSCGYTVQKVVDPTMTHDRWAEDLNAWLSKMQGAPGESYDGMDVQRADLTAIGELAVRDWTGATDSDNTDTRDAIERYLDKYVRPKTDPMPPPVSENLDSGTLSSVEAAHPAEETIPLSPGPGAMVVPTGPLVGKARGDIEGGST